MFEILAIGVILFIGGIAAVREWNWRKAKPGGSASPATSDDWRAAFDRLAAQVEARSTPAVSGPDWDAEAESVLTDLAKEFDRVQLAQFATLLHDLRRRDSKAVHRTGRELLAAVRHPATLQEQFAGFASHLATLAAPKTARTAK